MEVVPVLMYKGNDEVWMNGDLFFF